MSLNSDLTWREAPAGQFALSIEQNNTSPDDVDFGLWVGSIRFSKPPKPDRHRLLIQERPFVSADHAIVNEQGDAQVVEQPKPLI
jgi:hypothetical protein